MPASPLGLIVLVSGFETLSVSRLTRCDSFLGRMAWINCSVFFPILGLNSYSRLIVGKGERVGCGQEVVRPLHSFL